MKHFILLAITSLFTMQSTAQNVGIGTKLPKARLHVADSSVLFSAPENIGEPVSGPPIVERGHHLLWYARKGAFRTGMYAPINLAKDSIGYYSVAMGENNRAVAASAVALGERTIARGEGSAAIGSDAKTYGDWSVALGNTTEAIGIASTAMGNHTTAIGRNATAMGSYTTATGENATAMGDNTSATFRNATSMGDFTQANGVAATAMGYHSIASSTAATAMGYSTQASGNSSTALGYSTIASGFASTAFGFYNSAPSHLEMAIGSYNENYTPAGTGSWVPTDRLFTVGNGTSNATRSNALTILKNGNVGIGTSTPDTKLTIKLPSWGYGLEHSSIEGTAIKTQIGNGWGSIGTTSQDMFRLVAGGNAQISLMPNGHVGIGLSDIGGNGMPSARLDVNGRIRIRQTGETAGIGFDVKDASNEPIVNRGFVGMQNNDYLGFYGSGAAQWGMVMNVNTANVGIGPNNVNPTATLHIARGTAIGGTLRIDGTNNTSHFNIGTDEHTYIRGGKAASNVYINDIGTGNVVLAQTGGNVGIGTITPDQKLSVNGNASKTGGGTWATFSDARVKKNVTDYTAGLAEILAIRPVSFQYNELSGYADVSTRFVGIIAQEIETILPNTITKTDANPAVKDLRSFNGSELTFTLINAIKEQQQQIISTQKANEKLQQQNEALMKRLEAIEVALQVKAK